jgi:Domain of unknown function (DUF4279)
MAAIDRSTISLRIFGRHLDPDTITSRLGYPPTAAARTGEQQVTSRGEIRTVREGYWRLESGPSDAVPIEVKVRSLLNRLTDDLAVWQDLTQQYRVDIFCGLFMDVSNEGFSLPPDLTQLLGERHLSIGFDIYGPVAREPATEA